MAERLTRMSRVREVGSSYHRPAKSLHRVANGLSPLQHLRK